MTVKELKEILQNFDDNTEIAIEYRDDDMCQDVLSGIQSFRIENNSLILSEYC